MFFKELQKEDLNLVANIFVEAFNSPPWNDKWTEEKAYNRLSQMMSCEGAYGMIAFSEDKKICGMILGNHEYYYDSMHFNIKEFCVNKDFQGKGIGSYILDEFLERLKNKGIGKVILLTSRTEATEGFYKKREFINQEEITIMEKRL